MRRSEVENILTAARKLSCKLGKVEEALDCFLEDFFAPIQDIYDVIESSTKARWDDDTWDAIFDLEKPIADIITLIEKNSIEDREHRGEKEIKIFDEE